MPGAARPKEADRTTPEDPGMVRLHRASVLMLMQWEYKTAVEKWDEDEEPAKALLTLNIVDLVGLNVNPEVSSVVKIWSQLIRHYEQCGILAASNAEEHLKAKKYKAGSNLDDHWAELWRRLSAAHSLRAIVPDANFLIIICHAMPESMKHITTMLLTNSDPEDVITKITATYQDILSQLGKLIDALAQSDGNTQAFMAQYSN
ncbi:hypothetical protein NEOLEDRAFT_1183236 [Neolentinus lepideus HHB14362 ss-1]|uniref:Uncharacterized protein n=1 Tax=Neolentinus lepideus HHB14362 ss-1 TaxID=1314782 RepID=A0A165NGE7_9AGAM|nr:hypothetical protein NEOLEDRAFT_1183236 [Neolentinus lepideus HHB14362 ss-1]